jgi:5-methylcytosine-specific restriction endonuclease McrA
LRKGTRRLLILVMIAAAATLVNYLSGQDVTGIPDTAGQDTGSRNAPGSPDATSSNAGLDDLRVSQPGSMSGYSRENFPHWSNAAEFGWDPPQESCDVRDAALIRDGDDVVVESGCYVESGSWLDPYTNTTFTDPSDLDIDHVVPLANAWRSGASSWDEAERERYANDPEVLLSVEDNANQSKGDKGPEAWKPPNRAVWCDYAGRWIRIKSDYDLSVNPQEKTALKQMLDTCKSN